MNNLLHLKYAVEVEKTGSISKAAQNLYMNQPQLSKAIRELESSLGIEIFDRTSTGVFPTKKGAEFLIYAKNILIQIDAMQTLSRPETKKGQILNVSVPRASYVSNAFTQFLKELDPDVGMNVDYRETHSVRTMKSVSEGSNDIGIIRYQTKFEAYFLTAMQKYGLEHEDIFEFEYLLLMSEQHPLSYKNIIEYKDLLEYTEIVHGDISVPSLPVVPPTERPRNYKNRIAIYERASQLEILNKLPYSYMWVSPMPKDILDRYSLIEKKCSVPKNRYKDLFIYREGYVFTEYDKLFMKNVRQSLESVVKEAI
ncbi:MAG TPA: LysR family transcriptional regulator [Clostridia bacterium]|nr:MAG: HTH-type transcriptional regulator CysB [Firmicutes bacterium ADurb.Bin146]HOD93753.1 LysR family transcriptional regulator [Clostridia bacterium]